MVAETYVKGNPFDGGPTMQLQRKLHLIHPGSPRVARRAICVMLISWVPLAVLAGFATLASSSQTGITFFSDFGVHARYLIATPALILAEADCIPRLGEIAHHFATARLVSSADLARYDYAISSTRKWLDSTIGVVITIMLAYGVVIFITLYASEVHLPEWTRQGSGSFPDLTAAGWFHALVSLPLLLLLLFGWVWRLVFWTRFLFLMARLDLRLIPGHPDHCAGLKFVSSSLRKFRLISFAIGAIVAGAFANRVVHENSQALGLKNFAIGLTVLIVIFFAGPLTVFVKQLRQTKKRGIFEYGALAADVGVQFENKWLVGPNNIPTNSLEMPDFSATTDLYSVVANVYEMKDVPFSIRDLFPPLIAGLVPFIPVGLLMVPFQVVVDSVVKMLL